MHHNLAPEPCRKHAVCIVTHHWSYACHAVFQLFFSAACGAFNQLHFVAALVTVISSSASATDLMILLPTPPLQHWLPCISSLVCINAYKGKTVDTFVVALGYFIYMIKDAWEKDKHVHTQENQKYMVHNFMKKMYTEGFELPTSRVKVRHSTTVPLSHTWSWTFCKTTKL